MKARSRASSSCSATSPRANKRRRGRRSSPRRRASLSESLDYEVTVARVAQLAVPVLADWCAVDLAAGGQRTPPRLAVAHTDPAKVEMAKELDAKYPPDPDAATGVPNVLRTGRSEIYPVIPDELLVKGCVDAEHLRIARALGLHSRRWSCRSLRVGTSSAR